MSASLVGSEMCIRDRSQCELQHPRGREMQRRACPCHRTRRTESEESSWAVSYTHLTLPTICSV
eukprot:10171560-Alexandrium_andersonii.AAC.1